MFSLTVNIMMFGAIFYSVLIYSIALYSFTVFHYAVDPPLIDLDRHGQFIEDSFVIKSFATAKCTDVCSISVNVAALNSQQQYRLKWFNVPVDQELLAGEIWQFKGRYSYPQGYRNPGISNPQWRYAVQGLAGDLKVSADCCRRIAKAKGLALIRGTIREVVMRDLPLDTAAVVLALIIDDRSLLTQELSQAFALFGLSHILSVSGLHISMAASIGYLVSGPVWAFVARTVSGTATGKHFWQLIICLLFAWGYALLTAFSMPTQRALIMICVVFLSRMLYGQSSWWPALQIAFIAVVCFQPYAGADAGFWLSFLAVGLLLILSDAQQQLESRWTKITGLLKCQVCLTAALWFLSVQWQSSLSFLSLPLNLVLVPLSGWLIMPGLFITLSLALAGYDAPFLAFNQVLGAAIEQLKYLSGLRLPQLPMSDSVLIALIAGLLLLAFSRVSLKPFRVLLLVLLLVSFLARTFWLRPHTGEFRLTVMDAGQGTSAVIQTHTKNLMYDTGPGWPSGFSVMAFQLGHYLRLSGFKRLDMLVISHEDADHAGGLQHVMQQFAPSELVTSYELPFKQNGNRQSVSELSRCHDFRSWWWDGVLFQILPSFKSDSSNNRSCIMKVSNEALSVLLPGDIELEAESYWVRKAPWLLDADVLVAPHHGSKTSSSTGFIHAVSPETVIFTASDPSRFNHPSAPVLQRYRVRGIDMHHAGKQGAFIIDSTGRDTKYATLD